MSLGVVLKQFSARAGHSLRTNACRDARTGLLQWPGVGHVRGNGKLRWFIFTPDYASFPLSLLQLASMRYIVIPLSNLG
jgi:hypothetical protein